MKKVVFNICGGLAIFSGSNTLVRMRHVSLGPAPRASGIITLSLALLWFCVPLLPKTIPD